MLNEVNVASDNNTPPSSSKLWRCVSLILVAVFVVANPSSFHAVNEKFLSSSVIPIPILALSVSALDQVLNALSSPITSPKRNLGVNEVPVCDWLPVELGVSWLTENILAFSPPSLNPKKKNLSSVPATASLVVAVNPVESNEVISIPVSVASPCLDTQHLLLNIAWLVAEVPAPSIEECAIQNWLLLACLSGLTAHPIENESSSFSALPFTSIWFPIIPVIIKSGSNPNAVVEAVASWVLFGSKISPYAETAPPPNAITFTNGVTGEVNVVVLFTLTPSDKNESNVAFPNTVCDPSPLSTFNIHPVVVLLLPTSEVAWASSAPEYIAHSLFPSHIPSILPIPSAEAESVFCVALGIIINKHAFGGKLNPVKSMVPVPVVIANSLTSIKHSNTSSIESTKNVSVWVARSIASTVNVFVSGTFSIWIPKANLFP